MQGVAMGLIERYFYRENEKNETFPQLVPPNVLDLAIQETERRKQQQQKRNADFATMFKQKIVQEVGIPEAIFKSMIMGNPAPRPDDNLCPICRDPRCLISNSSALFAKRWS
jgi:hypothetical protein